jgi:magnesium-transporting ATPase (P-type)
MGTLTTNRRTVVGLVLLEKEGIVEHTIQGTSYSPVGTINRIQYNNKEVHQDLNGAVADVAAVSTLCNNVKIVVGNGSAYEEQSDDEMQQAQQEKANK